MMQNENTYHAKILIVDDRESDLIALEYILEYLPVDIVTARSGDEALQLIIEHEFVVVILDVAMPDMDGFETANLMRKNRYTEGVPIIFVTAINKEDRHVVKGYECGAIDYLFKPIDADLLQAKVKIFLNIYNQKAKNLLKVLRDLQSVQGQLEKSNRKLEIMASRDSLNELPNRRQLEGEIDRCISYANRYNTKFAVFVLGVNNLKDIYDEYGGPKADSFIQYILDNIQLKMRQEDFFSRIEKDKFAIVLTRLNSYDNAGKVADMVSDLFIGLQEITGDQLSVSLSTGIACFPFAGETHEDIIKNADIAMCRARNSESNAYQYFNDNLSKEYVHRATVESALKQAISNQEFYFVYQLIYELKTKKPVGVEALMRWHHPKLGDISPVEFIPISEESGLIHSIGRWVIETSCRQFSEWCQQGYDHFNFAINLSPKQLQRSDIVEVTKETLLGLEVDPRSIILELTEAAIMDDNGDAENMLRQLNSMGVQISIDDFGSGYSSLVRLKHLPIHSLKIDRPFIDNIVSDENNATIVKTILSMASNFGFEAIAEGIETEEQLQFLIDHGCQYGQGFHLSEPMSVQEITKVFAEVSSDGE